MTTCFELKHLRRAIFILSTFWLPLRFVLPTPQTVKKTAAKMSTVKATASGLLFDMDGTLLGQCRQLFQGDALKVRLYPGRRGYLAGVLGETQS